MPLSPHEHWRRLDALFQAVVDLPDHQRALFIDRETAGDEDLGRELRQMLACATGAGRHIAAAVGVAAQHAMSAHDWIGRRMGPYRIVREIGRGGMGIVFEASRDDDEFQKTVALKVGCSIDERFRTERQILAGLEHPCIARFLDAGAEQGVPYLVMEYVEGRPITGWCDLWQLNLHRRIALFRRVCDGVDYAHEHMIVHRDLKPANILVGHDGQPKLLDFGIAKLLAPAAEDPGATTGMRVWTPDYTSPEQVRGGRVTTRTDVYSLGLILYELLCGQRAQTADWSSPLALDRSICEMEPPLPSVCAQSRGNHARARELRGDLDRIVAMAIRKEPERRYSSAAALSDDLGRYLANRPIQARPNTAGYRLVKFVRRQRLAAAFTVLLAASVAGGIIATVHQARVAQRRFEQVRGIANAFIFEVHDRIKYLPGATEARRAIVDTALRYLENVRREAGADAGLRLELAAAYERIGDVQGEPSQSNLGDTRGALASFRRSEELLNPLYRFGDGRAGVPLASALLKIATVRTQMSDGNGAVNDLDRAHDVILGALASDPRNGRALTLAADIDDTIVRLAWNAHDARRGQWAAEESMHMAERLVALHPDSLESRDYLSQARSSLGSAYRTAGDLQRSADSFRAAVELREQLVREQPGNAGYRRNLMVGYGHLSDALGLPRTSGLGDYDGAADALRKAGEIAKWLCQSDPADRKARFDMANADFRLGAVLLARGGRTAEAVRVLKQAQGLLADLQKQDPANGTYAYESLYVDRKYGEALAAAGRYTAAARELKASIDLAPHFHGTAYEAEARNGVQAATVELAKLKSVTHDRSAIAVAGEAEGMLNSVPPRPAQVWAYAVMFADIGRVYRRMGQPARAASCLAKSAQLWKDLSIPPALEGERRKELAAVTLQLASLH